VYFSDPDILNVDPAFGGLTQGNTTIQRLWHGDVNGKPILDGGSTVLADSW